MKRKPYEKELRKLQTELCRLQEWVKAQGAAGDRGLRGARRGRQGRHHQGDHRTRQPARLPARRAAGASDREKTQMYLQRYMPHFPAAGEVVIFDRSWYNRAGVERVMGFCSEEEYRRFLENCPIVERYIVDGGIILVKFWLEVGE